MCHSPRCIGDDAGRARSFHVDVIVNVVPEIAIDVPNDKIDGGVQPDLILGQFVRKQTSTPIVAL